MSDNLYTVTTQPLIYKCDSESHPSTIHLTLAKFHLNFTLAQSLAKKFGHGHGLWKEEGE